MPTTPYWLDRPRTARASTPLAARTVRKRPDVIVIGGGVTGLACALRLAEAGVRVRLHERGKLGSGASGRNGGFALRGAAVPYDALRHTLGRDVARSLMALTERGLGRLRELAGDAFRPVGSLRLAADADEAVAIEAERSALAADGFAVEGVERLAEPLDRLYSGAIVHPPDGAIDPGRWIARLAAAAAAAGAELLEDAAIDVASASAAAGDVVVATDGGTAALLPELATAVRPTRGQVLATEPQAELRFGRPHYARGGFDYWQQLPDGRLVLGGQRDASVESEWTDADETTTTIQTRLELLAEQLLGRPPVVTHRWSGSWGTTPDGLPVAGKVAGRERVWVAGGYSGHGNVLGLVCGELIADALLGADASALAPFDPERFG